MACAVAGLSGTARRIRHGAIDNLQYSEHRYRRGEEGLFRIRLPAQAPVADGAATIFIYNPRLVVGLPHDMEFGLNFPIYHSGDFDPSSLAYIQPNFKWKFFNNDAAGAAASAGVVVNTPLNSREGQGTWSYIYGNVSKKIMAAKGARVTAGGYGVVADQDSEDLTFAGTRGGVLARIRAAAGWPGQFRRRLVQRQELHRLLHARPLDRASP